MMAIYWQQIGWLALIPLPIFLRWLQLQRQTDSRLSQFIQQHLWPRLLSRPSDNGKTQLSMRPLLIWLLLCLALAGPGILSFNQETAQRSAANVVFIIDISPSMGAQDITPNRLEQSKKLTADFVQSLDAHRLALIAFSANAYTVSPLSHDHSTFLHFLDSLDPSLVSVTGSNLSRALLLARQALNQQDNHGGLVILISDGEIHDSGALDEARHLASAGHQLHTLAIGTEQGAPVPLAGGRLVKQQGKLHTSQMQRGPLQILAKAGQGSFQDLSPQAWASIQQQIDQLQQSVYQSEIRRHGGQPLFPFLIIAALLLLFWQCLQRPQNLALILCGLFALQTDITEAAPWTETQALKQLNNSQHEDALKTYSQLNNYNGLIGQGVAAYELGRWSQAQTAFEQAYTQAETDENKARAAYNLGNTHTQLGNIEAAQAAFQQAIVWQADYPNAQRNLALLKRAEQEYSGAKPAENQPERDIEGIAQQGKQTNNNDQAGDASATGQGTDGDQGQGRLAETPSTEALQQSLKAWSQNQPLPEQISSQAWQQFRNLKEESRTILMRRFEIEDKRATGLVETKPW